LNTWTTSCRMKFTDNLTRAWCTTFLMAAASCCSDALLSWILALSCAW
jgi:hypothetical protein